jgi:hypothetical protein
MSVVGAMNAGKKQGTSKAGSARGVLPAKGDIIETQWTEDDEYCPTCRSYRPRERGASGMRRVIPTVN